MAEGCEHPEFHVEAHVNRVTMSDTGKPGAFVLMVKATCKACATPFWFPGMGTGLSYTAPTTGTDGFQAALPIVPANRRNAPPPALIDTAVNIRGNDGLKGILST